MTAEPPIYCVVFASSDVLRVKSRGLTPLVAVCDDPDLVLIADVVLAHVNLPRTVALAKSLGVPVAADWRDLDTIVEARRASLSWAIVITVGPPGDQHEDLTEADGPDDNGDDALAMLHALGMRGAYSVYRFGWYADDNCDEPWIAWATMTDAERRRALLREGLLCT